MRVKRGDDGAVLVLVLAFVACFGLVVVALLGQGGSSLATSAAVSGLAKKVYAADSGIDFALEAVQTDSTLCPGAAGAETTITSSLTVDADVDPVRVTCRATSGNAGGWRGYAVITTSTAADSLSTQSGGPVKEIGGSVFVNGGTALQRPVLVSNGNYVQPNGSCPPTTDLSVAPSPPYTRRCGSGTLPTLDAVAPTAAAGHLPADTTTVPGCTIFSPGTYATAPSLAGVDRAYFKSGVYAIQGGEFRFDKISAVGGTAGPEVPELDAPCLAESAPDGDGVTFVLTGDARLTFTNQARVELHGRRPLTDNGTPGISVFVDGTRSAPSLEQLTGNPQVVIHGTVYSPQADIGTNATGGVSFYMLSGIVASRLALQSTGDGLRVATTAGQSTRTLVLTSTATKAGSRDVVARAVVDLAPDRSLTLKSRRSD